MGAVGYRFTSELRRRAGAWIALGLILGISGGALLAAIAGARRTESTYDRFVAAHDGMDAVVGFYELLPDDRVHPAERLPGVAESVRIAVANPVGGRDSDGDELSGGAALFAASRDGRLGTDINRWLIVEGHAPRLDAADEVVITKHVADQLDFAVGDSIEIDVATGVDGEGDIETVRVTIVGHELAPNELEPLSGGALQVIYGTPALIEERPELFPYEVVGVRLQGGADAREAFTREAESRGLLVDPTVDSVRQRAAARDRFRDDAAALFAFAVVGGLATFVLGGQALARQQVLDGSEVEGLRAVGMARRELRRLAWLRASAVAIASGVTAVVIAVALSLLAPVGEARAIEVNRGIDVDGLVVGLGGLVVVAAVLGLGAIAAEVAIRRDRRAGVRASPTLVAAMRRLPGLRPRLAANLPFERGGRFVPTASVFMSVAVAVGAVVGASTFAASLTHLEDRPALYGKPWDLELAVEDYEKLVENEDERALLEAEEETEELFELTGVTLPRRAAERIADDPSIAAVSLGNTMTVDVESLRDVTTLALEPIMGELEPSVIDGRLPRADDEVAVGAQLLDRLELGVGDTVEIATFPEGEPVTSVRRIVGRSVTAPLAPFESIGGGMVLPPSGGSAILVRFDADADRAAVLARLEEDLGVFPGAVGGFELPDDLLDVDDIAATPELVVGLTAFLGVATLIHFGAVAARRHARHLAVLRALGLRRGDCVRVLGWHSVLVAGAGLVIGTVLGLVAGRLAWLAIARGLYVVPVAVLPSPATGLIAVLVVVAALISAMVPGMVTTRAAPGAALAAEGAAPMGLAPRL